MVVMVAQEVFNDTELYTLKWLRWQLNIHWNIGLMPKLQNFGHLMRGADSSEMTPILGKTEGRIRHDLPTEKEQTFESFLKWDSISFCWVISAFWRIRCRYLGAVTLRVA